MFKKVLAGLATVGLALGMVVATATTASAHHNDINAVISCTDDYQYKVDWSVANSESIAETITSSSDSALVPVSTVIPGGTTSHFVEYFGAPTSKTLTLGAKWTNNVTNQNSGSIKANQFPPCSPQHIPVTLCHATPPATAAQGWNVITIDDDAVTKQGHDGHDADIIPSFDYWEQVDGVWTQFTYPGKNLGTNFSGFTGAEILGAGCALSKAPAEVTFADGTCTAPGVAGPGSYTIPESAGVTYSVRLNNAGGYVETAAGTYPAAIGTVIQVKAEPDPGWVVLTGTTSWSHTIASPGDCIVLVTPVAPDVTTITECGSYGSVIPKSTPGVLYTLTGGDGEQGAWELTATPLQGYKFDGPQSVTFSGNLGTYTDCVTPTAPEFADSVCTGPGTESGGSYTIYETEGVQYQVKIGDDPWADVEAGEFPVTVFPNTVTVRAIALDGYTLKDYTGPWSHDFVSAGECLTTVTPVAPDVTTITECGSYGSVIPKSTPGVEYTLTQGDGKQGAWQVTAVPADGYQFAGDQVVYFDGNLGAYTDCVTPGVVTFHDTECDVTQPGKQTAGSFTIPVKEGVQYSVSINGGAYEDYEAGDYPATVGDVVEVKATAELGYTLTGTTEWSHEFESAGECLVSATPVAPTFADSECAAGVVVPGSFTIPDTDGVEYSVSINGGASTVYEPGDYEVTDGDEVTVTAAALEGYELEGDSEWSHTFAVLGTCDLPTKAEVLASASFTNASCLADGSIQVVPAEHVRYFIDGVEVTQASTPKPAGTHTVTAETDSIDYTIIGTKLWSFDITKPTGCATVVLASTGSAFSYLGLSAAGGLLFLGAAVLYMRRRFGAAAE